MCPIQYQYPFRVASYTFVHFPVEATMIRTSALRVLRIEGSKAHVRWNFNSRTMATSSNLPRVSPPLSTTLPTDAYQLLPESQKAGTAEDILFEQQVQDVQDWWGTPRFEGIKRDYSAEDIVSKRGSLQQTYPSSLMARKLFDLLKERAAASEPVHTSV